MISWLVSFLTQVTLVNGERILIWKLVLIKLSLLMRLNQHLSKVWCNSTLYFPIADPATMHSALRSFTSGLISISLEHSQCSWDLVLSLDTFSLV